MMNSHIQTLAKELIERCIEQDVVIATAESCTGGLISAALTDVAGSSAVVDRGFVTYSNEAKAELLRVSMENIEAYGAVSERVAREMVRGAIANSRAHLAVAVTGIAGPGGGSPSKPVGLVFIGVLREGNDPQVHECRFADEGHTSREEVRFATVVKALELMLKTVS